MNKDGLWESTAQNIGTLVLAVFALLLFGSGSFGYDRERGEIFFKPDRAIGLGFSIAQSVYDAFLEAAQENTEE